MIKWKYILMHNVYHINGRNTQDNKFYTVKKEYFIYRVLRFECVNNKNELLIKCINVHLHLKLYCFNNLF